MKKKSHEQSKKERRVLGEADIVEVGTHQLSTHQVGEVFEDEEKEVRHHKTTHHAAGAHHHKGTDANSVMNHQLMEIYKNPDGSLPDMSQFKVKKRRRFVRALVFLFVSIGVLGGVAFAGFFFFQPQSQFSEEDVILSISGDEQVKIGEQVRYRIRYRNAQNVPLASAVIQMRYPEGFVFESASVDPTNDGHNEWTIGAIDKQDSGFIDIYGRIYGDIGSKQSFRMFLNYYPSNFSSEFQKVATQSIEINRSPASLTLVGPEQLIGGVEAAYTLTVAKNDSDWEVPPGLYVEIEPAEGFVKTTAEPASDEYQQFRWSLASLSEEKKITLRGSFANVASGKLTAKLVGFKDQVKKELPFVYANTEFTAPLSEQTTGLSLVVNGSTGSVAVQPGETLNVSMKLKNSGETDIANVRLRAMLDAPSYQNKSLLYWNQAELITPEDGAVAGEQIGADIRRGVITWDARHLPVLKLLKKGEEVQVDFSIPILNAEQTTLANFLARDIKIIGEMQYEVGGEKKVVSTQPLVLTLNSDTVFSVRDEIGQTAEAKEKHSLTWLLENTYHELKDITASAEVFGNTSVVTSTMAAGSGNAVYDEKTKRITWSVPTMPTSVDVLPFTFVLIRNDNNPTQTQLMSKVKFEATDVVTGERIVLAGDEVLLKKGE